MPRGTSTAGTPLIIGEKDGAYCAASESFAFINVGYRYKRELGPAEVAFLTADGEETVADPQNDMKICAFLWTYFGYTTSIYEGRKRGADEEPQRRAAG